jgi:hypothetical protein
VRTAVTISVVFHVTLMALTVIDFPFINDDEPRPMTIIPVELVRIADVTNVREMAKEPEPEPEKEKPEPPEKPLPERKVEMPPPPPKMASTMPLEQAKPEPKVEPKPEPPVQQVVAPSVDPRPKPRAPSRFSSDRIAALLDKREDAPKASERLAEKFADREQKMSPIDLQQQTMSIADAVRKRIYDNGCWNVVSGAMDASNLKVAILMYLTPDGNLARPPVVMDTSRMNDPAYRTAAESARRAVQKCVPYELPKDKYELWREMQINFDPKEMLTG